MHQCDYCCWYNPINGSCDCPIRMKKRACEAAIQDKEFNEKLRNTLKEDKK